MGLYKAAGSFKKRVVDHVVEHPYDASFAIGLPVVSYIAYEMGREVGNALGLQIIPILMGAVYGTSRAIGHYDHRPASSPAAETKPIA